MSSDNLVTVGDCNELTQEKMRGDCYVRLLIKPEERAARKESVPFPARTAPPDPTIALGEGRPHLQAPPDEPMVDESGNVIVEDEFEGFEQSHYVVLSFVRHNRYEAVEALVQQDSKVLEATDENGNSLLHVACQNNNRRIVKLLVKNGISVNAQNDKGNTPLHYCYQYRFNQIADYLIANNAEESLPNKDGLLPAQGLSGGKDDAVAAAQRELQSRVD